MEGTGMPGVQGAHGMLYEMRRSRGQNQEHILDHAKESTFYSESH